MSSSRLLPLLRAASCCCSSQLGPSPGVAVAAGQTLLQRLPWGAAAGAWAPQARGLSGAAAGRDQGQQAGAGDARAAANRRSPAESSSSSDEDGAAAAAAEAAAAQEGDAELQALQQLLSKAQEEASSFKDRWQRSHAEMQNLIARQAREKETMQTYAVQLDEGSKVHIVRLWQAPHDGSLAEQKFAQQLLEVADNLESAAKAVPKGVLEPGADISTEKALGYLKSLLEGVQATERVLLKTMGGKGVQRIETAEGDAFDPNTQEAMSIIPSPSPDKKPGTVANVWQSGYKMHDRILRAAKVIVYQE